MAKAILGRGLGQLLEAHKAIVPTDGTPVEERPAARMGMGVRTLLAPAESPAPTPPAPRATPVTALPAPPPEVEHQPPAPQHAVVAPDQKPTAAAARAPSHPDTVIFSLLAADALLCLLAGVLLCHPGTRDSVAVKLLSTIALATGAWLACQAALHGKSRAR